MRCTLPRAIQALMLVFVLCGARLALACGGPYGDDLPEYARQVASDDPVVRAAVIDVLRQAGPSGLDALFAVHGKAILAATADDKSASAQVDPAWELIRQALDTVGGQRDCATSHLYWYTDLDGAKAAARDTGKPILSLRLLGKLTDELSCANSRFFRSTLYANQSVSASLRERFVLHWQSVRPVPVVTIDFGDGRTLRRTVTGNSIHYVLDADGRPIDALPGLYGPQAFLRGIERAEQLAQMLAGSAANRNEVLAAYHRDRLAELRRDWARDLSTIGAIGIPTESGQMPPAVNLAQPVIAQPHSMAQKGTVAAQQPRAVKASKAALPKHAVEAPILAAALTVSDEALAGLSTDDVWTKIARLHVRDAELDAASRNIIARQTPTAAAAAAAPRAITKRVLESPLVRLLRNLQQAVALDSVRNEYLFHRQIHAWFAGGQVGELNALNERVYAELFLTPCSDPWLGLMPADTYTALENCGVADRSAHYNKRLRPARRSVVPHNRSITVHAASADINGGR